MLELAKDGEVLTAIVTGPIDDSDVRQIAEAQTLWLRPGTSDLELSVPLRVPQLRMLYVKQCHQPLIEMVRQEDLARLSYLIIADSAESLSGILQLGILSELKSLCVRRQKLASHVVEWICQQAAIEYLAMTDTNASDSILSRLNCRLRLNRLDVYRTDVSLRRLEAFNGPFPHMRSLDISETTVSSDSIATIKFLFPRLERFMARDTQLSAANIKEISLWGNLMILDTNTPGVDFDRHGDPFWD